MFAGTQSLTKIAHEETEADSIYWVPSVGARYLKNNRPTIFYIVNTVQKKIFIYADAQ